MTLISSLNIAQQALSVSQAAITVVSNNIANVDNENYSKLRVNLTDVATGGSATNVISQANALSGVQMGEIERYSNSYLQNYYWKENSAYSYADEYATVASSVEDLMNELKDTGLSSALSTFYNAVNDLNANPTNSSARENYVSAAQNVCTVFNSNSDNLNDIKTSLVGNYKETGSIDSSEIASQVDQVNNLLDQIATVNSSIVKTSSSDIESPALLDKRDGLISQLSKYIPVTIAENGNGTINVSLNGMDLVEAATVTGYLSASTGTAAEPAQISIIDPDKQTLHNNVNNSITTGSIGAILSICGSDPTKFTISGVVKNLDTLASGFATVMNTIQNGNPNGDTTTALCLSPDGKTLIPATENIFVIGNAADTVVTADNISVNANVIKDPNLVAAARLDLTKYTAPSQYNKNTGDNTNATLILSSRNKTYATELQGKSVEGFLSNAVSTVGTQVASLNDDLATQTTVLKEVKTQLSSETGVNMDEELVDLMKYQRAYQSAARVFSTCNDLMDTLMNLGK